MKLRLIKPHHPGVRKSIGQGMTEYIIIVGVIAVAAIGVFGAFGNVVENQMSGMAAELSGGDAADDISAAQDEAEQARGQAAKRNNLSNYNDNGAGGTEAGGGGN